MWRTSSYVHNNCKQSFLKLVLNTYYENPTCVRNDMNNTKFIIIYLIIEMSKKYNSQNCKLFSFGWFDTAIPAQRMTQTAVHNNSNLRPSRVSRHLLSIYRDTCDKLQWTFFPHAATVCNDLKP